MIAILLLMAALVGIVIGIFRYHAPATPPAPVPSYVQTGR